jgi:hypothetical protein
MFPFMKAFSADNEPLARSTNLASSATLVLNKWNQRTLNGDVCIVHLFDLGARPLGLQIYAVLRDTITALDFEQKHAIGLLNQTRSCFRSHPVQRNGDFGEELASHDMSN